MHYQTRDLAVVAVAALGAGYLLGATTMQQQQTIEPSDGVTIVKRLELQPAPRHESDWQPIDLLYDVYVDQQDRAWPIKATDTTNPDRPLPPPEVTPAERSLAQQPERPRDGCYPGHRENFFYHGVLHWRCRYER